MTTPRLLSLREVVARTRLSRSEVYRRIAAETFPRPIKLTTTGGRSARSAWVEAEVSTWIRRTIAQWRDLEKPQPRRRTEQDQPAQN